jgi:hypothetical protein
MSIIHSLSRYLASECDHFVIRRIHLIDDLLGHRLAISDARVAPFLDDIHQLRDALNLFGQRLFDLRPTDVKDIAQRFEGGDE